MTSAQIEACVKRLPVREAIQFRELQQEASRLMTRAWELRREAWEIYRPWRGRKSKMKVTP